MFRASQYPPMTQPTATCPVDGCEFADTPSLVAAHINGTADPGHDWSDLPYDGPGEFLRAVREASDGNPGDDAAGGGDPAAGDGNAAGDTDGGSTADPLPGAVDATELRRAARATFAALGDLEGERLADLAEDDLVDLYTLLSVLSGAASSSRSAVREELLARVDGDVELSARFGTVSRGTRTGRSLRDEGTVAERLAAAGVDPEAARSFDEDLVAEAVEEADVDEEAVFELEKRGSVRRVDVDEERIAEYAEEREP